MSEGQDKAADSSALVPIEQREVKFYGDDIAAVLAEVEGQQQVFVPIRPLCDFLGVTWDPQRRRINRDAVLSKKIQRVTVTVTDSYRTIGREMLCLPLDYLNGWLFGINASRVNEEIRDRLIRYQEECYQILSSAFFDRLLPADTSSSVATLVQVREMGRAIMQMAEEQIEFERRLSTTENTLETTTMVVGDLTKRMETIEQRITPGETITEEQASQLSQAVKAVAMELSRQSGRNEYGGVYGELYRKFSITSYKLLPVAKFQEAMDWLSEWFSTLSDSQIPF